ISGLGGQLLAQRGVMFGLGGVELVAVRGAAMGVQVVRLVEFPDLVAQGVLDGVSALLPQAVGPDMAVFDQVRALVAERGQNAVHVRRCGLTMVFRATPLLGGGADIADLAYSPVAVVVGRTVGVGEALPADLGLPLPTEWTDTVAISTALWRADVQRRRLLVNAAFAAAAMSASALRWLTSPPASAPAGSGPVRVGHADIEAIQDLTLSYRELDNRLGGGRLRTVILSYLHDHV